MRAPSDAHLYLCLTSLAILCLQVIGMVAEEASLFKSALMPARFCFKTITNEIYTVCTHLFVHAVVLHACVQVGASGRCGHVEYACV